MELRQTHHFDPFSRDGHNLPDMDFDEVDYNDPESIFRALGGGVPGGIPIPKFQSPKAVRREAKMRRDRILRNYAKLHDILDRHEATIQKRWAKKTKAQRLQVLLQAWPNMAPNHRPDFEAFRKETEEERMAGTKYRDWWMWPYINQEDLSRPRTLPLLLSSRGRHHPSNFAAIDAHEQKFAFTAKAVVPIYLNEYMMFLNGVDEKRPDDYGKLAHWHDHENNFDLFFTQRQFLPGEGLLVLESQDRLLSFLVDCCKEIMRDIPEDKLLCNLYPVQPEPRMKEESESTGFDSLAVLAAEAPYRVPAKLDFGRIESLLGAQAAACEDHLWSLREDPSYFAEKLNELKDHRLETLKDENGLPHPISRNDQVFWSRIISSMLVQAYLTVEIYNELHRQAQELKRLQIKYAKVISIKDDLPKEYLKAILKFKFYLSQATKGILSELKHTATSSPPLRYLSVRISGNSPDPGVMGAMDNPNHKRTDLEMRLLWLLATLWEDGMALFLATQSVVVDELERLLRSEPQANQLISPYIAGLIGQLSVVTQCMHQIEIYQPWARSFEHLELEYLDSFKAAFAESSKPWQGVVIVCDDKERSIFPLVPLGKPSDNRFFYPVDKRRTKENVETLRRAERNLDEFWEAVDRLMFKRVGNLANTSVGRLLSQPRSLQRTSEWIEPPASASTKKGAKPVAPDHDLDILTKPFSSLYFGIASSKVRPAPSLKTKVKTRGTANPPAEPSEAQSGPSPSSSVDQQPTLAVDARSLKVFRTLFYNPYATSSPGEVPWNDFLHAMTSTGFMAEKLYGSVWQFRPTRLDVERAIQFHEPHPKGKLPFTMARRIGRRLNRAYGWTGSIFVSDK